MIRENMAVFTSYRIAFRFVSQHHTVWCKHTFLSTFMLSMSKTLNIILICLDGEKTTIWEKCKSKCSYSNNKNVKRIKNVFLFDDEIQSLLPSVLQFKLKCKLVVNSFEMKTNARNNINTIRINITLCSQ